MDGYSYLRLPVMGLGSTDSCQIPADSPDVRTKLIDRAYTYGLSLSKKPDCELAIWLLIR